MTNTRSTEHGGVGQSGYTAGRQDPDLALECELEAHNTTYPRGTDEELLLSELGTDDRFTGRGGTVPHEPMSR